MQRKLAAVLAADIVGYSALMGADQDGTLEALRSFRTELFGPTVAGHHGKIVKSMGDGWLVEFGSAVEAVNCAISPVVAAGGIARVSGGAGALRGHPWIHVVSAAACPGDREERNAGGANRQGAKFSQ